MKNRHTAMLILVTCIFAAFTLGFLAGRSSAPGDTIITKAPPVTEEPVRTFPVISANAQPAATSEPTEPSDPAQSGLVNINSATAAQLDTLPGIGPVLAQRIIDYREANGPFTSLSQLMLVEGIGEKRLADMLPLITIE